MAEYVVTVDGYVQTANGRSRVYAGRTLSLTDQERAANAHLFVVPERVVLVADEPDLQFVIQPKPKGERLAPRRKGEPTEPVTTVRKNLKR